MPVDDLHNHPQFADLIHPGRSRYPRGAASEELKIAQRAEFERWGPVVRASGFKA